jgi:iron complex outermembrane receptor protein
MPVTFLPRFRLRATVAHAFVLTATAAAAQQAAPPAAPASAPSSAAAAPPTPAPVAAPPAARPRPAAAAPAAAERIEITGGRNADVDERRQSTAAKIVIGREEIDKFGDATVGEVLRRLPGVSTPGAPGRGGPPRMRGLGNGYTQLLIDGQRVPPGFSIESLTPEQVERIEILRAPTAETGSQAIAGTINIITREGFKRRLNDLRGGFSYENGKLSPGLNWTHNDSAGDLTYNISGSAFAPRRESINSTRTTVTNIDSGTLLEDRTLSSVTDEKRFGANLTSRLQWRLGEGGDQIALTPSVFHTEATNSTRFNLVKQPSARPGPDLYDFGDTEGDSRFTNARLGLQWRQKVGPVRLEVNGGGGSFKSVSNSIRNEFGAVNRVLQDNATVRENAVNLVFKGSGAAGGNGAGEGEHNLVSGAEIDASRRNETKTSPQNGLPLLVDYSGNLQAQALRTAAYVQDEWAINPSWSTQAGLRWEGINTRGDNGSAVAGADPNPTNRSSVWTPLFHAVWKPDPKKRDQLRLSLTRSYRPPSLGTLIARPTINRDAPVPGPNGPSTPDTVGNPSLKPELATGIDLAFERYLDGGGVLSANLFHREISNLMRNVLSATPVPVSWSPGTNRYVRQMQNIGDATTSGLEMDAKFRLDQVFSGAPGIELRSNLSLYTSKVKTVPGPDNRLDQQAKATGNFGGDYRLRGVPLTLGGNVNWVPAYTTKTDVGQFTSVTSKQVWDAYALWTFSPAVALRLLGNNLVPRDYTNTTISELPLQPTGNERTTVGSTGPSYINWALRLELKL